jgi:hypothetical protein
MPPQLPCCTDLLNMKLGENGELNGTEREPESYPFR